MTDHDVTVEQFQAVFDRDSRWGRYADPDRGAWNLVGPEQVAAAAATVTGANQPPTSSSNLAKTRALPPAAGLSLAPPMPLLLPLPFLFVVIPQGMCVCLAFRG